MTTHLFYNNRPLCLFTNARLVDWPVGHDWAKVTLTEIEAGVLSWTTCASCAKMAYLMRETMQAGKELLRASAAPP